MAYSPIVFVGVGLFGVVFGFVIGYFVVDFLLKQAGLIDRAESSEVAD